MLDWLTSRLCPASTTLILLVATACTPRGAQFSGQTRDPRVATAQMTERSSVPPAHRLLGLVEASCDREEPAFGELEVRQSSCRDLGALMCSEELLSLALRERAAEVGGTVLVGRRCQSSGSDDSLTIRCSAEVAAPKGEAPASVAAGPLPVLAEVPLRHVKDAWQISVMFTALTATQRASRSAHLVAEQAVMPVQNIVLGDLLARCDDPCDPTSLRESLRVAAGRVGASDVVGVRCLHQGEELVCSARAAGPAVDPRSASAAR